MAQNEYKFTEYLYSTFEHMYFGLNSTPQEAQLNTCTRGGDGPSGQRTHDGDEMGCEQNCSHLIAPLLVAHLSSRALNVRVALRDLFHNAAR